MHTNSRSGLLLALLVFTGLSLRAQGNVFERFPLAAEGRDLQSPAEFLGYRLGERFTEYARSVAYFDYLAENSERLVVERYGETYERRPLLLVIASSDQNISQLDQIKQSQLELVNWARTRRGRGASPDLQPVINSYSYNIHGNEASSTEAAMQFAYELATTADPELVRALEQTVNLLFVCINPDGRDRYVYWANGMKQATAGQRPADLDHHAPWPNGRTNHYWFDLNRDWVWGVHPESRGHTAKYQEWMPNVHTDYHEQGYDANYFTVPGTTPRNLLLPDDYEVWADTFGRANIAAFEEKNISYFTRDRFDFYYPSYGSSYPSVMGAIGMLTEQGGIGANLGVETEDGYVLTLRQRVYDHYATSLAQLKAAARNRRALIDYSLAAWNPLNSKAQANAYLIENDGSIYFNDFLEMLLLNGVEVERTTEPLRAEGLSYRDHGRAAERTHPAGSLIVPTEQPRHLFVNSLLSLDMQIEDSVMYDMSTWSAPLAYNLEAFALSDMVKVDTEPVTKVTPAPPAVLRDTQNTDFSRAYAYIIPWNQRHAPRALARLWKDDFRVRAAHRPFTDDAGRTYPAGSLIVLRGRNGNRTLDPANYPDVEIVPALTGRMAAGMDLASTRNFPIKPPRAALLVEPPFNTYTSGQLYFLFDQETELPVDRIRASLLEETDLPKLGARYGYYTLNDYDVLVLPDGRLGEVFGNGGRAKLKDWIQAGGTLITIGRSAEYFTDQTGFANLELLEAEVDTSQTAATLTYAERTDYFGKKNVPGSALHATVDVTHPLGFGVKPDVYTLKFGSKSLRPARSLRTVGRYATEASELLAAGYVDDDALNRLKGNTWAGVLPLGKGRIVYFLDNPHYRMFWRGPSRMMQNAVMIVPGM